MPPSYCILQRGQRAPEIRFCDVAAQSLLQMTGLATDERWKYEGSDEERDGKIAELEGWWAENRDSIDWGALGKRREKGR